MVCIQFSIPQMCVCFPKVLQFGKYLWTSQSIDTCLSSCLYLCFRAVFLLQKKVTRLEDSPVSLFFFSLCIAHSLSFIWLPLLLLIQHDAITFFRKRIVCSNSLQASLFESVSGENPHEKRAVTTSTSTINSTATTTTTTTSEFCTQTNEREKQMYSTLYSVYL